MMQQTFDLRLATLAERYRNGKTTPRSVLADIRQRAQALNPEFRLFIHILSEEEQEPFLAALDGLRRSAAAVRRAVRHQRQYRSCGDCHHRCLSGVCVSGGAERDDCRSADCAGRRAGRQNQSRSVCHRPERYPFAVRSLPQRYHAEYPSGGSSAGSALAVALGVASFALGTDTAGSGASRQG
jgi:allophanate hydrolase